MPALSDRLAAQLTFITELDRLKTVLRQTMLVDGTRRENDAEHSWHIAVMALVLAEYAEDGVDIGRVVKMLLLHDVVEIDAGDTFIYDSVRQGDQSEREARAAQRLFGLLPADQALELRALWEEFEARETRDARFAGALDRVQPVLNNYLSGGLSWQANGVTADQVMRLNSRRIGEASPILWEHIHAMVEDAVRRGYLAPAPDDKG